MDTTDAKPDVLEVITSHDAAATERQLLSEFDETVFNQQAIRRAVTRIFLRPVPPEVSPLVLLNFLTTTIEDHAVKTGQSLTDELHTAALDYLKDEKAPARPPEFYRQTDLCSKLGKSMLQLMQEAGYLPREQSAVPKNVVIDLDATPTVEPLPKNPIVTAPKEPKPAKAVAPKVQSQPIPPVKNRSTDVINPEPIRPAELKPKAPIQPVTQEMLGQIKVPEGLQKLNDHMRLPEQLLKVLAVHIGLAEGPITRVPKPTKLLNFIRDRDISQALDIDQKHRSLHPAVLTKSDHLILNNLIAPTGLGPLSSESLSYEEFKAELAKGKTYKGVPELTADTLQDKIRELFVTKLPFLLSILPNKK